MILGIVGSPRKGHLTDQLITKCLNGAQSAGVETEKIYLIDYKIPIYTESAFFPEDLNAIWASADSVVIGAPVYWGSINGLTKDFMDTLKILDVNGRYGIGISVAGGTGRGLCSGIQTIYRFFYHRRIRGIEPVPVSRFNFEKTLKSIQTVGKRLGELSKEKKPFEGDKDRMEHYEKLDYLNYTYLDEMLLLAEQLIEISKDNPKLQKAKTEYERAESYLSHGNRTASIEHAVKAYNMLYFDPQKNRL